MVKASNEFWRALGSSHGAGCKDRERDVKTGSGMYRPGAGCKDRERDVQTGSGM